MSRYFIRVSYCGTAYNGWQSQPYKNTKTIQGTLEKVMSTYFRDAISLTGCGRTDTGVHARGYYAHFDLALIEDLPSAIFRLNKMLPSDIAVHEIIRTENTAHCRFDAISRSYEYHLHTAKDPFADRSFYYAYEVPDIDKLNEAAAILLEYRDFTSFCKANTDVHTKLCNLKVSQWQQEGSRYVYRITADRFLRGMIRLIVGMCLQVSRDKLSLRDVKKALEDLERLPTDWSVPAIGLTLCDIKYPYF